MFPGACFDDTDVFQIRGVQAQHEIIATILSRLFRDSFEGQWVAARVESHQWGCSQEILASTGAMFPGILKGWFDCWEGLYAEGILDPFLGMSLLLGGNP